MNGDGEYFARSCHVNAMCSVREPKVHFERAQIAHSTLHSDFGG